MCAIQKCELKFINESTQSVAKKEILGKSIEHSWAMKPTEKWIDKKNVARERVEEKEKGRASVCVCVK